MPKDPIQTEVLLGIVRSPFNLYYAWHYRDLIEVTDKIAQILRNF
jgi:hypothetical protein